MDQKEFIYHYNDKFRPKFNDKLFKRTDDELIDAIRNVIYSCERNSAFTIKVLSFTVIDNYDDINYIMWEYEDQIINKVKKNKDGTEVKKSSKSKKDNQYSFINLKDSDIKLIKIVYFIQINEKKNGLVNNTITVYIAIPRLIDDFYFKINGNIYSAMYQIVDASTYNNTASKKKEQIVTLKTVFTPIRLYRYNLPIKDINGKSIMCTYFISAIFRKSLLVMKYIIAKMGYEEAKKFMCIEGVDIMKDVSYINRNDYYIFPVRNMYVVVSKLMFDSIQIVQSFVYTLLSVINYMKDTPYERIFDQNTWLKALGGEFTSFENDDDPMIIDTVIEKGKSIIGSLEFVYDRLTMQDLKLSIEDKSDIYRVLRWMMYEFNALRQKDNLDISTKKVRWAEYLASMYAIKISRGIYNISDKGVNADLNTIRKAIQIPPMYLINQMIASSCQLVNYKSCVNDMDALIALKYTYKGLSGIGEKSNSISQAYRNIHPSHLGRVDIDTSSNSDPGVSGSICPLAKLHDGHFDEYQEPSTWKTELSKVIDLYKLMNNKKEMCRLLNDHNIAKQETDNILEDCISINKSLLEYSLEVENQSTYIDGYDLFGDGLLFVSYE